MSVPYECTPQAGFVVAPGATETFTIDFPSRSVISKIIVIQTDGVPANFSTILFNNAVAADGTNQSESVGDYQGLLPPDLYRVTPTLTATAGKLIYFSETANGGHGFVFFNQDKDTMPNRLGNPHRLYLQITVPAGGGGNCTFAVTIAGEIFK